MNRSQLIEVIRECISEVLSEGRKVCAWCKKDLGPFDDQPGDSHGICDKCAEEQLKDLDKIMPPKKPSVP